MTMALVTAQPAFAEIETAAQTQARAAVEAKASQVGVAPTEAQAVKDQATLMPTVKEAVKAGDAMSLLEHSTNPSVTADVIKTTGGVKVKRSKSATAKHKKTTARTERDRR